MNKSASIVEMSQEYSSTTQTAIVFLQSFKNWVIEAIITFQKEIKYIIDAQGVLVISDLGCWDGSHFFEPLKEIIIKLRELFGNNFKIKVIYSDLTPSPQGFSAQLLKTPQLLGTNVEVLYYKHNFYYPLPYLSNITLCTLGTHWLSKEPSLDHSLTTLFPVHFRARAKREVEKLAHADLKAFFKSRQKDTNGFIALVNLIKIKENQRTTSFTAQAAMQFMDKIFYKTQQKKGVVPFFYRSSEEFLSAAKVLGYQIDRAQNFIFPCDYVNLYKKGKITRTQLIDAELKMARAWSQGSITHLLGVNQIDSFYHKLRKLFEKSPEICGSDYHLQFLVLRPKKLRVRQIENKINAVKQFSKRKTKNASYNSTIASEIA